MLWLEILGLVVGYLLLGLPALRIMWIISKQNDDVDEYSLILLIFWPLALPCFVIGWFSKLAFKWSIK